MLIYIIRIFILRLSGIAITNEPAGANIFPKLHDLLDSL